MNISVVIPVRNDLENLRKCINYIESSDVTPFEILVVDDASDKDIKNDIFSESVIFIKLDKQGGPARARNLGAQKARGDVILFIDSDVFIKKDIIEILSNELASNAEDAVVGVFDDYMGYSTFWGDYKNLWMKYSYENIPERAALFYTSLAAIRKDIFLKTGGFNENYSRPSTEDTAYGNVLWNQGIRPLISTKVKAIHNKEYSLWGILRTDFYRASDLVKMKLRKDLGQLQDGNRTSVPETFILSVFTTIMACMLFLFTKNFLLLFSFVSLSVMLNIKFLIWLYDKRGLIFALKSAFFLPIDHLAVIAGMTSGVLSYFAGNRY